MNRDNSPTGDPIPLTVFEVKNHERGVELVFCLFAHEKTGLLLTKADARTLGHALVMVAGPKEGDGQ